MADLIQQDCFFVLLQISGVNFAQDPAQLLHLYRYVLVTVLDRQIFRLDINQFLIWFHETC